MKLVSGFLGEIFCINFPKKSAKYMVFSSKLHLKIFDKKKETTGPLSSAILYFIFVYIFRKKF